MKLTTPKGARLPAGADDEAKKEARRKQRLAKLKAIARTDLPALERKLQDAGAPWTPGRMPEWNGN